MASQLINGNKVRASGSTAILAAPPGIRPQLQGAPGSPTPPPGAHLGNPGAGDQTDLISSEPYQKQQAQMRNGPSAGSGTVTQSNGQPNVSGNRTGPQVTSAGGTPISVDNNQQIRGQATAQQNTNTQIQNPNSVFYDRAKDPLAVAQDKANAAAWANYRNQGNQLNGRLNQSNPINTLKQGGTGVANGSYVDKPKPPTSWGMDANGYNPGSNPATPPVNISPDIGYSTSGLVANNSTPLPQRSYSPPPPANMPAGSPAASTSAQAPAPTGTMNNTLGLTNSGSALSPADQRAAETNAKFDPNAQIHYGKDPGGDLGSAILGGLKGSLVPGASAEATLVGGKNGTGGGGPLDAGTASATDVANQLGGDANDPNFIDYLINEKGFKPYDSDGDGKVDTLRSPGGTKLDGTEVTGFKSDPENSKEMVSAYKDYQEAKNQNSLDIAQQKKDELLKSSTDELRKAIDAPIDTTAVEHAFDQSISAIQATNARNKALALRGMQERGARGGISVNQMMGMQTEAGYGYDTQNSQQLAAINLAKEGTKLQTIIDQNNKKIQLASALFDRAANADDQARAMSTMHSLQAENDAKQANLFSIQQQANAPSLGMTLAKVGIGVGGAVAGFFTGGATVPLAGAAIAGLSAIPSGSGAGVANPWGANNLAAPPGAGLNSSTDMSGGGMSNPYFNPNNVA